MVRSKNYLKTKKILVVCHDAGGADVISSWIFVNKLKNFNYYIKGPSIKIFKVCLGLSFAILFEFELLFIIACRTFGLIEYFLKMDARESPFFTRYLIQLSP